VLKKNISQALKVFAISLMNVDWFHLNTEITKLTIKRKPRQHYLSVCSMVILVTADSDEKLGLQKPIVLLRLPSVLFVMASCRVLYHSHLTLAYSLVLISV